MIVCRWSDLSRYESVIPGLKEAVEVINNLPSTEPGVYPLSCGKVMVQKGTTKPLAGAKLEAHRQYLDIHYVLEGYEVVGWAKTQELTPVEAFDTENDGGLFTGGCDPVGIPAGSCYVVFPEDAHAPNSCLEESNDYKKIVVKLKV